MARLSLAGSALVEEDSALLARPEPDVPFRILLLGDFTGRANRGLFDPAWEERRPVRLEHEDFDAVLARMAPELEIPLAGCTDRSTAIRFHALDDFRAAANHPGVEAVEAVWHGALFLMERIRKDAGIHVFLLDVTKAELAASLVFCDDLMASAAYREIVEAGSGMPGAFRWAVVAGLYAFDAGPQDQATLARMATVARLAGAPFIAEASARLLGCECVAEAGDPRAWTPPNVSAVRRRHESRWLGLAFPRMRLRCGGDAGGGERALWGNPAVACACALAQAFAQYGWQFRASMLRDLEDLPRPCAEVPLADDAVEKVLACGIMPLVAAQQCGRARFARLQSFADPAAPLAGAWD